MIVEQGITASAYHADPCATPSLSSSCIRTIINETPRHAMLFHPRLGGFARKNMSRPCDIGSAAHKMLLGKGDEIEVIPEMDYKKLAAQADREAAYANGKIPLLVGDFERVQAMAKAARPQLGEALTNGRPEVMIAWQEQGVWIRSLVDWLPFDESTWIEDYKTTRGRAHPKVWGRSMVTDGYDIQAALYLRGYRAVFRKEPKGFRFIVQEQNFPHLLSFVYLTERTLEEAGKKIDEAIEAWKHGLDTGDWPGYPDGYHIDV